jgi:hypothetical protein
MALFMDVHNIEGGVSVEDVAGARGRSSALSKQRTPRMPTPSIEKHMVLSLTRSIRSANTANHMKWAERKTNT